MAVRWFEMSEAVEWARLGFDIFKYVIGWVFQVITWIAIWIMLRHVWRFYTEGRAGEGPPAFRVLLRRLWCRHPHITRVSRSRHLTHIGRLARHDPRERRCTRCGVNIDAGRRPEDRR